MTLEVQQLNRGMLCHRLILSVYTNTLLVVTNRALKAVEEALGKMRNGDQSFHVSEEKETKRQKEREREGERGRGERERERRERGETKRHGSRLKVK